MDAGTQKRQLGDLSFVGTHDCFTIAELIEYKATGLAQPGEGTIVALEGETEKAGLLPVDPSGALKAKVYPSNATGVSMHVLSAMQLTSEAGDFQVRDAGLAGIFNMAA